MHILGRKTLRSGIEGAGPGKGYRWGIRVERSSGKMTLGEAGVRGSTGIDWTPMPNFSYFLIFIFITGNLDEVIESLPGF